MVSFSAWVFGTLLYGKMSLQRRSTLNNLTTSISETKYWILRFFISFSSCFFFVAITCCFFDVDLAAPMDLTYGCLFFTSNSWNWPIVTPDCYFFLFFFCCFMQTVNLIVEPHTCRKNKFTGGREFNFQSWNF